MTSSRRAASPWRGDAREQAEIAYGRRRVVEACTDLQPSAQRKPLATAADCLEVSECAVNWEAERRYGVEGFGPFDEFSLPPRSECGAPGTGDPPIRQRGNALEASLRRPKVCWFNRPEAPGWQSRRSACHPPPSPPSPASCPLAVLGYFFGGSMTRLTRDVAMMAKRGHFGYGMDADHGRVRGHRSSDASGLALWRQRGRAADTRCVGTAS